MGAADHSADPDPIQEIVAHDPDEGAIDRSHNRDTLSSEVMTEMLRDLQDSMLALDERIGTLEAAHHKAATEKRRLTVGVLQMGDEMNRRLRTLEEASPKPATETPLFISPAVKPIRRTPDRPVLWSAGLAVVLAAVVGLLWLLRSENTDRATTALKPPVVVASPQTAPAKTTAASTGNVAASKPVAATPRPGHTEGTMRNTIVHHPQWAPKKPASSPTIDKTEAVKPPAGFQLYGQSASPTPPH